MRVRIRFTKEGKVRWTSHRDLARIWERALRRAEVPVAYTSGFQPRPRLSFGLALSTGHESRAEYLDIDMVTTAERPVDPAALPDRLTPVLPVGVTATAAAVLPPGTPSLQEAVTACTWRYELAGISPADAEQAVTVLLAADTVPLTRSRKGHESTDDIRPAVLGLAVAGPGTDPPWSSPADGLVLVAELATQPRGLRPAELLAALFPPERYPGVEERRVCRLAQWIDLDGARWEPLPPDATSSAPAERACA